MGTDRGSVLIWILALGLCVQVAFGNAVLSHWSAFGVKAISHSGRSPFIENIKVLNSHISTKELAGFDISVSRAFNLHRSLHSGTRSQWPNWIIDTDRPLWFILKRITVNDVELPVYFVNPSRTLPLILAGQFQAYKCVIRAINHAYNAVLPPVKFCHNPSPLTIHDSLGIQQSGIGSILSYFCGLVARIPCVRNKLSGDEPQQGGESGQEKRNSGYSEGSPCRNCFIRRMLLFVCSFFFGLFLAYRGWNYFYGTRKIIGATLLLLGFLIPLAGLTLFIVSAFEWSWQWFL
jgi:hypothetical protein